MSHKRIARTIITLKEKINITPHFIRGVFTSDHLAQYAYTTAGDNNKIFIPPEGIKDVHFAITDEQTGATILPPLDVRPLIRTYTHRYLDLEKKELYIDFVNHGNNGPASAWINRARAGDQIGVAMRTEQKALFDESAQNYVLAGDATALPVLSVILERLPRSATVQCFLEVHGQEDEQKLYTQAQAAFTWVHNPYPERGSLLADIVMQAEMPLENKFAYIAAEFSIVKTLRRFFRKELNWKNDELYAYSYWKSGTAESDSAAERKEEKEQI